jgi:hypothetical protein
MKMEGFNTHGIPIYDVKVMEMLQRTKQLCSVETTSAFFEFALTLKMEKQFATIN